jgi:hypothetical protein
MRHVVTVVFALLSVYGTAFAQAPGALTEAMPLLRDTGRVALRNVRIIDGTGAPPGRTRR